MFSTYKNQHVKHLVDEIVEKIYTIALMLP
jgi:hypothetical protein